MKERNTRKSPREKKEIEENLQRVKKAGIFPMNYTILLSQNQYSKQAAVLNVNTYYIGTYTTTANTFKTLIYPF